MQLTSEENSFQFESPLGDLVTPEHVKETNIESSKYLLLSSYLFFSD